MVLKRAARTVGDVARGFAASRMKVPVLSHKADAGFQMARHNVMRQQRMEANMRSMERLRNTIGKRRKI